MSYDDAAPPFEVLEDIAFDPLLDPSDVDDGKGRAAVEAFSLERASSSQDPVFPEAFGLLDREFAPRGEIERREVVVDWLDRSDKRLGSLFWHYHLLLARAPDGSAAGARDCHVTVDAERRECVIYLAHTLVLEPHRRSGLASMLRAAPLTLARHELRRAGVDPNEADVLLAAEMEPADHGADDTLVRLVAYGRSGFLAVPPPLLPYCQPDFRDVATLASLGVAARPLPLLAIVRRPGHPEATLPARLAAAYVRHLNAVFATHCREEDLARPLLHALAALEASGLAELPLLSLPRTLDDHERLAPLWREAVLPYHLPELRADKS
jgi:hypothetical protein